MANQKIMVVDDSRLTRALLAHALTEAGYSVVEAANGDEALKLFDEHHPAVVITDFMMPGMDGIELARRLKSKNKKLPIILISVEFNKEVKLRSEKIGIKFYLFKNFEKKDLLKKVKAALEA